MALAVPAAAASLAYLNARWRISHDLGLIRAGLTVRKILQQGENDHDLNLFSALEDLALDREKPKFRRNRKKKGLRSSERICLIFEGRTWTYKAVYDNVLQYAAWLNNTCSVKPRDIVAMAFTNSDQFIFLWFALWSLGCIPAFINYNLTGQPLIHSIKVSSARVVIVDPLVAAAFSQDVKSNLNSVEIVHFDDAVVRKIARESPYRAPDSARYLEKASEPSLLIYTSGTTGLPKPAIVACWKTIIGFTLINQWLSLTPEDRIYCAMPLYHASASLFGFLPVLNTGSSFVLSRKFSTAKFWPECRESGATVIQYVGETLRYLLASPPSDLDRQNNVRIAIGNGLRPDIWDQFKDRFGVPTIAEFYTATESTDGFWNLSSNSLSSGAISSRGLLRSLLARGRQAIIELDLETEEPIRDPSTGLCRLVPVSPTGEMVFNISDHQNRTPQERFAGYFNNTSASNKKIITDVVKKGDVWYRTGDLMVRDHEGQIYFSDRLGDTYRWKAENVSTNEVAEAMGRTFPIAEANVYGVQLPYHDGRAGCAAVVFKPHVTFPTHNKSDIVASNLMNDLASRLLSSGLPRFAVPVFVRVMKLEEMERTGNNKPNKQTLKVQGVDLDKYPEAGRERVWWLKDGGKSGGYVPFTMADWKALEGGRVRL